MTYTWSRSLVRKDNEVAVTPEGRNTNNPMFDCSGTHCLITNELRNTKAVTQNIILLLFILLIGLI